MYIYVVLFAHTHTHTVFYRVWCYLLRFWNLTKFHMAKALPHSVTVFFSLWWIGVRMWRRWHWTLLHCLYQPVYVLLDLTWDFTVENIYSFWLARRSLALFVKAPLFPPAFSPPIQLHLNLCVCVCECVRSSIFFYRMTSVHGKRRIRYTISFHDFLIHLISHIRGAFKMVHFVSTPFFVSLRLSERIP